jgi:hypothetical protein
MLCFFDIQQAIFAFEKAPYYGSFSDATTSPPHNRADVRMQVFGYRRITKSLEMPGVPLVLAACNTFRTY